MKKWMALFLALLLTLGLCACDRSSEETPTAAPTDPAPEPTDPPEPPAPEPNFYVLKEISANLMGQEGFFEMKILLNYDENYHLLGTDHYDEGALSAALTYRDNTLDLLGKLVYRDNGELLETYVYEYDEKGNPLTFTGTDSGGNVFYSRVHAYDGKGQLSSYEDYYNGQLSYWESYGYDEDGLRDSFSAGDGDGNLYQEFRYTNVMENGKLRAIITLKDGEYWHTIAYNENGDPVTEVQYTGYEYQEVSRTQYTYTETGKPLGRSHTNKDGKETYRVEYEYDELDQLVEIRKLSDGQLAQQLQYTYENGLLMGYKSYTYGSLEAEYSYSYEPVVLGDDQAAVLTELYAQLMNHE